MLKHFKSFLPLLFVFSSSAFALDLGDIERPIDSFAPKGPHQAAVLTLRDEIKNEGSFALGGALLTIGRADLTGLNTPIDSFDNGTLEVPIGGFFDQNTLEEPATFGSRSRSRGDN